MSEDIFSVGLDIKDVLSKAQTYSDALDQINRASESAVKQLLNQKRSADTFTKGMMDIAKARAQYVAEAKQMYSVEQQAISLFKEGTQGASNYSKAIDNLAAGSNRISTGLRELTEGLKQSITSPSERMSQLNAAVWQLTNTITNSQATDAAKIKRMGELATAAGIAQESLDTFANLQIRVTATGGRSIPVLQQYATALREIKVAVGSSQSIFPTTPAAELKAQIDFLKASRAHWEETRKSRRATRSRAREIRETEKLAQAERELAQAAKATALEEEKRQRWQRHQVQLTARRRRDQEETNRQLGEQNQHLNSAKNNTQDLTDHTEKLLLSWRSIVRLAAIQTLHKAIYAMMSGMKEGTRQAIELQKAISEIRTIEGPKELPFNTWASGLRNLSDSWGLEIIDQAEGAYQTLSNQVTKGVQVFSFLEEANQLAVTGVGKTSEAVNVLTASINAFDKDVSQAEAIAASFFKTIELGRTRLSELQDIGKVAVPANQLGIELEELQAALAATTIRGVKTSEAQTLLRNVLMKMIAPTKEMKKLFRELGVESGEAAIQTYGLFEFLREVEEATKGSSTELAKLFSRIRATTGAMMFDERGIQTSLDYMQQIKDSALSYEEASRKALESTGKQLEIQTTQVKNFFLQDVGEPMLEMIMDFSDSVGGLANAVKVLSKALATLTLLGASYEAVRLARGLKKISLNAVDAAGGLLKVYKGSLTLEALGESNTLVAHGSKILTMSNMYTLAGVAVTAAIGKIIADFYLFEDRMRSLTREYVKASTELLREARKQEERVTQKQSTLLTDTLKEQTRSIRREYATRIGVINDFVDQEITLYESLADSVDGTFKAATESMKKNMEAFSSSLRKAEGEAESVKAEIASLQTKDIITRMDFEIKGKTPNLQAGTLIAQIKHLRDEAFKALEEGNKPLYNDYMSAYASRVKQLEGIFDSSASDVKSLIERSNNDLKENIDDFNEELRDLNLERKKSDTDYYRNKLELEREYQIQQIEAAEAGRKLTDVEKARFATQMKHLTEAHELEQRQIRAKASEAREQAAERKKEIEEQTRKQLEAVEIERQNRLDIAKEYRQVFEQQVSALKSYREEQERAAEFNRKALEQASIQSKRLESLKGTLKTIVKDYIIDIGDRTDNEVRREADRYKVSTQELERVLGNIREIREEIEVDGSTPALEASLKRQEALLKAARLRVGRGIVEVAAAEVEQTFEDLDLDLGTFRDQIAAAINAAKQQAKVQEIVAEETVTLAPLKEAESLEKRRLDLNTKIAGEIENQNTLAAQLRGTLSSLRIGGDEILTGIAPSFSWEAFTKAAKTPGTLGIDFGSFFDNLSPATVSKVQEQIRSLDDTLLFYQEALRGEGMFNTAEASTLLKNAAETLQKTIKDNADPGKGSDFNEALDELIRSLAENDINALRSQKVELDAQREGVLQFLDPSILERVKADKDTLRKQFEGLRDETKEVLDDLRSTSIDLGDLIKYTRPEAFERFKDDLTQFTQPVRAPSAIASNTNNTNNNAVFNLQIHGRANESDRELAARIGREIDDRRRRINAA